MLFNLINYLFIIESFAIIGENNRFNTIKLL